MTATIITDPAWITLRYAIVGYNADASPSCVTYALLHPERGIVLIDIHPNLTLDPVTRLRQTLNDGRFSAVHRGYLRIIYMQLTAIDPAALTPAIDAALAADLPFGLARNGDWLFHAMRVLGGEIVPVSTIKPAVASEWPRRARMAGAGACIGLSLAGAIYYERGLPIAWPVTPPPATSETPAVSEPAPHPQDPPPQSQPPVPKPTEPPPEAAVTPPPEEHPALAASVHSAASSALIAECLRRADGYLQRHDIAAAQSLYRFAANAGNPTAMLRMGQTMDPVFLKDIKAPASIVPDPAGAQVWYERARATHDPGIEESLRYMAAAHQMQ